MKRVLLILFVAMFAQVRSGWADDSGVEVYLEVKAPDPKDPKTKGQAPQIQATVIHAPGGIPQDKFTLYEPSAKQKVEFKPSSMKPYTEGSETITIAFVMLGWEIWIGNDDLLPEDDPSRYPGVLKALEQALDGVKFNESAPNGSLGELIVYNDKAFPKIPLGPLANITGQAFGTQKDYQNTKGEELVKGIELALSDLHNAKTARKALIVITDGADTNPDAAKGQLANLKKQAAQDHIQTFAIIYKGVQLGGEPVNVVPAMFTNITQVTSAENIATALKAILARMADRVYLTFPTWDPKLGVGLQWDGKPHQLVVKVDKDDTEPVELTMVPLWHPPEKGGFPTWLLILLIALGAILLVVIGKKVFGGKEAPAPMPVAMPMAAPMPEAPKPAGPMKTVMIGAGGDQDGFPIVGWLVPLNGVDAYKTMRLRSGMTKIGTAPPADLVINDGFMSTEHCQITVSPAGFTLIDNGSTNGCYVNDRKIAKHELVDNDMITLGKTNFKFKSIN
jgi:hypothetical protein